jgi:hypothetical protein
MIHHRVEQGSEPWLLLRLGIPTASNFHKIVTPTGKFSTTSRKYAYHLVAEKLLNQSLEDIGNLYYVARGKELEPQAVKMYEFERDVETEPCGFLTTNDMRMGCTPDRLIAGSAAGLELKCPAPQTHVCYMLEGFGDDYTPQAQGQLLIGELDWVDRYSYHPELPPVLVRTYRDEAYIKTLADALDRFCDTKDEMLGRVRALGYFGERPKLNGIRAEPQEDAFGLLPIEEARSHD